MSMCYSEKTEKQLKKINCTRIGVHIGCLLAVTLRLLRTCQRIWTFRLGSREFSARFGGFAFHRFPVMEQPKAMGKKTCFCCSFPQNSIWPVPRFFRSKYQKKQIWGNESTIKPPKKTPKKHEKNSRTYQHHQGRLLFGCFYVAKNLQKTNLLLVLVDVVLFFSGFPDFVLQALQANSPL